MPSDPIKLFRTSVIGGFDRGDVIDYIKKLSAERNKYKRRVEKAEKDAADLRAEIESLQKETYDMRIETGNLRYETELIRAEKDSMRNETSAMAEETKALRAEMEKLKSFCAAAVANANALADESIALVRAAAEEKVNRAESEAETARRILREYKTRAVSETAELLRGLENEKDAF